MPMSENECPSMEKTRELGSLTFLLDAALVRGWGPGKERGTIENKYYNFSVKLYCCVRSCYLLNLKEVLNII
jgi:hypothetical protein